MGRYALIDDPVAGTRWKRLCVGRIMEGMGFPIKVCVVCHEEFELRPDKPGFANKCLECTEAEAEAAAGSGGGKEKMSAEERKSMSEANEARRAAMKNLLYRKDS